MAEQIKRKKGRPSKWGAGNSNKAAIAADIQAAANGDESVSIYYIKKLLDMGYLEMNITPEGKQFIEENK